MAMWTLQAPPVHVLDGLEQGLAHVSRTAVYGMHDAAKCTSKYCQYYGPYGIAAGVVIGAAHVTCDVAGAMVGCAAITMEGLRNTPDALATGAYGDHISAEGPCLESRLRRRPTHIAAGLADGSVAIGEGLFQGCVDLVERPLEASNLPGAVLGVGQGVVGLASKVTAGTLDFTQSLLMGLEGAPSAAIDVVEDLAATGYQALWAGSDAVGSMMDIALDGIVGPVNMAPTSGTPASTSSMAGPARPARRGWRPARQSSPSCATSYSLGGQTLARGTVPLRLDMPQVLPQGAQHQREAASPVQWSQSCIPCTPNMRSNLGHQQPMPVVAFRTERL